MGPYQFSQTFPFVPTDVLCRIHQAGITRDETQRTLGESIFSSLLTRWLHIGGCAFRRLIHSVPEDNTWFAPPKEPDMREQRLRQGARQTWPKEKEESRSL